MGGPEVSYDASAFLEAFPQVELVMNGEGEKTLTELLQVPEGKSLEEIDGITWRDQDGQIHVNQPRFLMNLDEIPFMYEVNASGSKSAKLLILPVPIEPVPLFKSI